MGMADAVDVSVVTLSKALGGVGGAICGSRVFCGGVVNYGRAFIYSTSLPAAAAAAAAAAIDVLRDEPERRNRLRVMAKKTRAELTAAGVRMPAGDSPILCCVIGSEAEALAAAAALRGAGLLVAAVRPPTVAPGSSRLRACLCSEHTQEEVQRLIDAIKAIRPTGRRRHLVGHAQRNPSSG
jgi:7-keto-8-aminopelargonate synthetase-like enzyme